MARSRDEVTVLIDGPEPPPARRTEGRASPTGCTPARSPTTSSASGTAGTLISAVLLLVSMLALAIRGLNLGIEFRGGADFQAPVTVTATTRSTTFGPRSRP